jgi:hypothetical protein
MRWAMGTGDLVEVRPDSRPERERSFSDTWLDMLALRAAPEYRAMPLRSPRVAHAVRIVEDALTKPGSGTGRCVPSAGALFPYDVLILSEDHRAEDHRGPSLYRMDLDRRRCVRLPVPRTAIEPVLRGLRERASGPADHLLLLSRPWLSMRKYGPRGYLYTHLDAGHAATNLLGTALGRGPATLRLRLPRQRIRDMVDGVLPFREAHSAVSVAPGVHPIAESPLSVLHQPAPSDTDWHGNLERFCWSLIPRELRDDGEPAGSVVRAPLLRAGALPGPGIGPGEWPCLAHRRSSCTRFAPGSLSSDVLIEALSGLAVELPTDLPLAGNGLRVTVAMAPGRTADACRAVLPGGDVRLVVSQRIGDPATISRLCMGQRHLGDAQVLVLLHIARRLVLAGPQALREGLFRAAAAVQLIYLGATRAGVAVTAVGGFDAAALAGLAGIPRGEDVIYLVALGVAGDGARKLDRLDVANAHGE